MNNNVKSLKRLLSISEAARELGISRGSVETLIKKGKIEVIWYEDINKRLIDRNTLKNYLSKGSMYKFEQMTREELKDKIEELGTPLFDFFMGRGPRVSSEEVDEFCNIIRYATTVAPPTGREEIDSLFKKEELCVKK